LTTLAEKKCLACHGGMPVLSKAEATALLGQLDGWKIEEGKFLTKLLKLRDFAQALDLANKVGVIAKEEGHHPDLLVRWGQLGIKIWTHAVDGLTESDFILAAKIDRLV